MKIWFETTVKFAKENEQGLLKAVTEKYLFDAVSHTEAEALIYEKLGERIRGDFQVKRIVPANISDVFFYEDADIWHKCKLVYLIADGETGREKKVTQFILLTAENVQQAYQRALENLSNMLVSFRVPSIQESPILEVYPFERPDNQEVIDNLNNGAGKWKPLDNNATQN